MRISLGAVKRLGAMTLWIGTQKGAFVYHDNLVATDEGTDGLNIDIDLDGAPESSSARPTGSILSGGHWSRWVTRRAAKDCRQPVASCEMTKTA